MLTRRRLWMLLALVIALGGFVFAIVLDLNNEDPEDPSIGGSTGVEELIPARNAEVLNQQIVGIDLEPEYTGFLTINDVRIPEDQLQISQPLGLITYQPLPGLEVEALQADRNCVTATYWPIREGQSAARTVSWCFTAA